ncbi:hypothetical protein ACQKWADRAFT_289372 [Trichoderma austrokoningii]
MFALALKGKTHINFSSFRDLEPVTARAVLRSRLKARSINLSGTAAIGDDKIEETLAAIDHDLDALYLLTPPGKTFESLPIGIMRALYSWDHTCSKVLISSMLAKGSRGKIPPKFFPKSRVLRPLVWRKTHDMASGSFPIPQILYQSTLMRPAAMFRHTFSSASASFLLVA